MTTLAMMGTTTKLREAGYRRLRATTVLAANSKHISDLKNAKLEAAFRKLRLVNFDMERVPSRLVEELYSTINKKMAEKIADEFRFYATLGNISDLGGCVGICELCGKGDSLDDGSNEDKLRYVFKLTNTAGGKDLWVGSSCILQHGLHVDGAATEEEARKTLARVLAQHIHQWKIEAWRQANPDHPEIPIEWGKMRSYGRFPWYPAEFWQAAKEVPQHEGSAAFFKTFRNFRNASRFYHRKGFLSPVKDTHWREAQITMRKLERLCAWFREAHEVRNRAEVYADGMSKAMDHISEKLGEWEHEQAENAKRLRKAKVRKPSRQAA
jgi:hypothetical protein